MEKQNKKGREVYEKEERKRLMDLVDRAYNNDPRIREERAREQALKDAVKLAKKEQKSKAAKELEEQKKLKEVNK